MEESVAVEIHVILDEWNRIESSASCHLQFYFVASNLHFIFIDLNSESKAFEPYGPITRAQRRRPMCTCAASLGAAPVGNERDRVGLGASPSFIDEVEMRS